MEQLPEEQSDKSRSMSDSGGLIDLSAVDSDRKEGESSLDKSSSSSGGKEEGEEAQKSKLSGGEAWLTDKLKDMKLIEEEEFDFDIPEEYLDISLEPSANSMQEDSLSPSCEFPGERRDQPLLQLELTQPCTMGPGWAEPANGDGPDVNGFPKGFNPEPAPLCLLDCEQMQGVGGAEENNGGDIGIFTQDYSSHPERSAISGDLIAFTPSVPSEDATSSAVQVPSEHGSPVLEPAASDSAREPTATVTTVHSNQLGSGEGSEETDRDTQGGADSLTNTDSDPAATDSGESGYVAASRSEGSVSMESREGAGSVNRSRLPTSSKQLRKCSIFDSSPVRCRQLEELREVSRSIKHSSSEPFLVHNLQSEESTILTSSLSCTELAPSSSTAEPVQCSNPEHSQVFPRANGVSTTIAAQRTEDSTILPSSSASITLSSSSSSCAGGASNGCESVGCGEREEGSVSLEDSGSSCRSQSSTGSQESQRSSGGSGPRRHGLASGSIIARAGSRSKLVRPGSKTSLLPSKCSSTAVIPTKAPRRLATKPSMLPAGRGSLQPRQAPSKKSKLSGEILKPKVGENINATKTVRGLKAAGPGNPTVKISKGPQLNGHSTRLSAPASRRNGRCRSTTSAPSKAEGGLAYPPPSQPLTKKPQLSTSIVSSGSPSVKQSTPIDTAEQENCDILATPKNLMTCSSPTVLQQPAFSLSSIEASMATPNARQMGVPQTDETYTVTQAGPGEPGGLRTPKTESKKRRSFIPTPGGQERVRGRLYSPVPCNVDTPSNSTYSKPVNKGGVFSPTSEGTPKGMAKAMPPPKTRRALNPRASGLQRPRRVGRGQGAVLGARNGRRMRAEGPMKAKQTFAFGSGMDFDYDTEAPIQCAKVVHSPISKENLPAMPHSEWSPIRKKAISAEDACIRCTKRVHK